MGKQEGLHRIAKVIRWIGGILAGLVLLLLIPMFTAGNSIEDTLWFSVGVFFVAAVFYFGAKAVAWVIEGFADGR